MNRDSIGQKIDLPFGCMRTGAHKQKGLPRSIHCPQSSLQSAVAWHKMAGSRMLVAAILLLLYTYEANGQGLTVDITVAGTYPPGFPESETEYRAASGPYTFTCTATGGSGSSYQYEWTSTCDGCNFVRDSAAGATSAVFRQAVHSGDNGTHTCTATSGGDTGSDSIDLIIVGAGIFVFIGDGATGAQPNNGLVISRENPGSGRSFRFFCRSDSTMVNVGELIGLEGSTVVENNFFQFEDPGEGGELRVESMQDPLTSSQQGIYTCCIPLESGTMSEINIGVYPSGFDAVPTITNPLMFTPGSSSSTLTCTSSTSIATTVTFSRDNGGGSTTTVGPLYDGQSRMIDGVTYDLAQTVTNRGMSIFDNVLTINQPLADILGSSFSCIVTNSIESSDLSMSLPIMSVPTVSVMTSSDPVGSGVVGEDYSITCTVTGADGLGATFSIMWLRPGGGVLAMGTESSLTHTFTPLRQSDGGMYTCEATVSSALLTSDLTPSGMLSVTVTKVQITNPGLLTIGEMATIQCTTDITNIGIEWLFNGMVMESDTMGATELNLILDPVNQNYNGRVYTCRVTVAGGDTISDMFTVITQVPMVSVATSPSGSGVAGEVYSITCDVVGADNLAATFSIEWRDTDNNMLMSGTSSSLTYTFPRLAESDAGTYTCMATISSTLLTNPLTPSDTLVITVFGVSMGSADNTATIVGGVVAGLLVIVGAVTAIVIVILVLRHRDHRSRLSIQQHDKSVKLSELANSGDVDIKTTECVAYSPVAGNPSHGTDISTVPCIAYGQTQQIPSIQDVTYETIPGETEQAPAHTHAEINGE